MILATHERTYRVAYKRLTVDAGNKGPGLPWRGLFVLGIIVVMALSYVWLRSSTEKTSKELQVQRREFAYKAKELENLRVKLEEYKNGNYIERAVEKYGLGLHRPFPGQVRRLTLARHRQVNGGARPVLAQNSRRRSAESID